MTYISQRIRRFGSLAFLALLLLTACSADSAALPPPTTVAAEPLDSFIVETTPAPTTTTRPVRTTRAARTEVIRIPLAQKHDRPVVAAGVRTVSSTAYCLRGRMANGEYVHEGAVASRILPRGSAWRVLSGPLTGRTYVVKDTGGKAYFDVWMPSCNAAIAYGRRSIQIAPA